MCKRSKIQYHHILVAKRIYTGLEWTEDGSTTASTVAQKRGTIYRWWYMNYNVWRWSQVYWRDTGSRRAREPKHQLTQATLVQCINVIHPIGFPRFWYLMVSLILHTRSKRHTWRALSLNEAFSGRKTMSPIKLLEDCTTTTYAHLMWYVTHSHLLHTHTPTTRALRLFLLAE